MNRNGSAYVYVMVVITSITVMLSVCAGIAAYQAKVTASYSIRAGMYDLCTSAIENAVRELNKKLMNRYDQLCDNTVSKITSLDGNIVYAAGNTPYDGEFHLKAPDSAGEIGKKDTYFEELFIDEAILIEEELFDSCFNKMLNPYTGNLELMTSYCIGTGNQDKKYITVWITRKEPNLWILTAHVSLTDIARKDAVYAATAQVSLNPGKHEERVIPYYEWRDGVRPSQFIYSIYACGEIINNSGNLITDIFPNAPVSFDAVIDASVDIEDRSWTEYDAVAVVSSDGDYSIDTGVFNDAAGAVRTLIINKGTGSLSLTGGEFYGTVVSRGEVRLLGVQLHGGIICGSNVTLDPMSNVQFFDGQPFSARISDQRLMKTVLDYLRITDFKSGSNNIDEILNFAKLSGIFSIDINRFDAFAYKIVKLQQSIAK